MIWAFHNIENKDDVYRGKDCMKKFCESLKEHAIKIINFEKTKMIPLTNNKLESYASQRNCHIYKKSFKINMLKIKNIVNLEIKVIILVNTEVLYIAHAIYRRTKVKTQNFVKKKQNWLKIFVNATFTSLFTLVFFYRLVFKP